MQLAIIAKLGVAVPAAILTRSAGGEAVRGRTSKFDFQAGSKRRPRGAAGTGSFEPDSSGPFRLRAGAIQEQIRGTNIRVFVAAERLLACELKTDSLDYRDDPDPVIEQVELPDEIVTQCQQIAAALELVWTGIDFRHTPDSQHVFLEANPSPMFLGFENRAGLPLTESLAARLI